MARGVKASVDERIAKQQELVDKTKARYEAELEKLKDLQTEKESEAKKELLKAIENSGKSAEEIMNFLNQ